MSTVLDALATALHAWRAAHPGQPPAAIRLGERLHARLLLDIAAAETPLPHLETERGRPVRYSDVEIFCDDHVVDEVRVV